MIINACFRQAGSRMKTLRVKLSVRIALTALLSISIQLSAQRKDPWLVPEEYKKLKSPIVPSDAGLSAALDIYKERCAQCHGETGKGDGPDAKMYSVKSADFTDTRVMSEMTDGEVFYKITEGRRPMPSFKKRLTEEQRWQLVHFLRTFAPKFANPSKSPNDHGRLR
jgi:mono/diheme cytochrome c family protein